MSETSEKPPENPMHRMLDRLNAKRTAGKYMILASMTEEQKRELDNIDLNEQINRIQYPAPNQ